jgi:hypothetical protein
LHGETPCMIRRVVLLTFVVPWLGVASGMAQTAPSPSTALPSETPPSNPEVVNVGSIGMRSGFDSNPTDILGASSSPYVTETLSYDYLRGSLQDGIGLKLRISDTQYDPNVAAPTTSVLAAVTAAEQLAPNWTLRTTLTSTVDDNWARRAHSMQLRNRVEYETSQIRFFTNVDTSLSSLNERNIFVDSGFLPYDLNYATATVLPGFAYKFGTGEVGASVAVSRVAFLETDILGLDHSHDIIQPNAFFSAKIEGLELEGSLSPYYAKFDTTDFDNVKQLLYTAKVKYPTGPWTFGLGSTRTMQDTTLPFSALDEAIAHEASVSYKIDDKNAVNVVARYRRDDYLGLGAWSTTFLTGIDYAHDFGDGLVGTAAASIRQVQRPDEIQPWALNLQVGLQKQLDFGATPKPAGDTAPALKPTIVR